MSNILEKYTYIFICILCIRIFYLSKIVNTFRFPLYIFNYDLLRFIRLKCEM